jgi:hypothetical protein
MTEDRRAQIEDLLIEAWAKYIRKQTSPPTDIGDVWTRDYILRRDEERRAAQEPRP